jgi:hypothetical protein
MGIHTPEQVMLPAAFALDFVDNEKAADDAGNNRETEKYELHGAVMHSVSAKAEYGHAGQHQYE